MKYKKINRIFKHIHLKIQKQMFTDLLKRAGISALNSESQKMIVGGTKYQMTTLTRKKRKDHGDNGGIPPDDEK